ncbi:MAG TPA: serine/threonine-protein kinase, partial [Anaeromyxobacteraceae bacterium]
MGQTVVGKYRVLNLIDRGGMGQVYRATHLALDRPVALKMLNRALLADPALVQRFHREARAASRLNHPNSVAIIDFGETEDGTLFMAMELVPGRSLARLIAEEFPLGTPRVGKIGSQILAALTEAHGLGILHCDLKPQNVMIESRHDETDVVKVVDFGIAKLLEGADGPRLTRAGTVAGTPGYMSPEQARGETLDPRSDLYSVGVILYELVTGKLPFAAPSPMGMVGKMLSERPTPPSVRRPDMSIPPDLEALIMRALSPDRQDRPASADEFRRLLAACAPATDRGKTPAAGAPGGAASPTPARAGAPATLASPGKTPSGRAREAPASPSSGATRIGPPPAAAPARRASLLALATSSPTWLEVRLGGPRGKLVWVGTLQPGRRLRLGLGRRIWLRAGNPTALVAR